LVNADDSDYADGSDAETRSERKSKQSKRSPKASNTSPYSAEKGEVITIHLDDASAAELGRPFSLGVCRKDMTRSGLVDVDLYGPADPKELFGRWRALTDVNGGPAVWTGVKRGTIDLFGLEMEDDGRLSCASVQHITAQYRLSSLAPAHVGRLSPAADERASPEKLIEEVFE